MSKSLKIAIRAGLLSYLASSLLLAILLAPYLSSLDSFGHFHPENTAKHAHPLQYFVQTSLPIQSYLLSISITFVGLVASFYFVFVSGFVLSFKRSRAPPVYL